MNQKKEIIFLSTVLIIGLIIIGFIIHYEHKMELKELEKITNVNESNNKNDQSENIDSDNVNVDQNETSEVKTVQPNDSVNNKPSNTVTYSANDKNIINTFSDIENDVDAMLKNGNDESVKDKAKGVFITLVDFIFYDGTINGVTFNELTDAGKQKVLSIAASIDKKIDTKFPGYKESISDKTSNAFKHASEVIKSGGNDINNFAKEKLGDEYYQEIINSKDEFVKYTKNALSIVEEVGSNLFNKGKDALNTWYQNFKNKK